MGMWSVGGREKDNRSQVLVCTKIVCFGPKLLCVCTCFLGMIKWVLQLCQSGGSTLSSSRGRGAKMLHYGLMHHLWDSLAQLSGPYSSSPSNLASLLTAAGNLWTELSLLLSLHLTPSVFSLNNFYVLSSVGYCPLYMFVSLFLFCLCLSLFNLHFLTLWSF